MTQTSWISIIGFGLFFGTVGFGLGRLRLHATIRSLKRLKKEKQNIKITIKQESDVLPIWLSLHSRKNESYINMQKAFTSIGSAGLAALAVIIATSNATPISMYLSAITFTSLLILPINLFSNQIKDLQRETSSIHDQISKKINNQNQQILLPPIIYRAPFKIVWGFAVILVMASFILFTIGIISLPECGKTSTHSNIPDSLNLIRYCLTK